MLQAEIITIGDELLIGQVVDTNSAFMAQRLNEWGISVYQITSVHDDKAHILQALGDAERHADVILLTGGLGPTKDDITKNVLCEYFGTELEYREDIRKHIETLYAARPEVLNRLTDSQCLFPKAAEMITNPHGSAQVMVFRKGKKVFISMPGVPREMKEVMEGGVRELLTRENNGTITHRTITVSGIPESALAIEIEDWENALPENIKLAYLPHPEDHTIRLRLSGYDVAAEAVDKEMEKLKGLVKKYLKEE